MNTQQFLRFNKQMTTSLYCQLVHLLNTLKREKYNIKLKLK